MINVFYKTDVPPHFRKTGLYKKAVKAALKSVQGEVSVIFVNAKEIRRINKSFLKHDYVTDVISFGYACKGLCGDIFVCFDTAKKNAALYKQSVFKELLTYVIHGALHLSGMDDKTPKLRAQMDKKTELILRGVK